LPLKAKVPHNLVQKILRHSDVRVTVGTYGHLDLDDMRMVMDDLATRGPSKYKLPTRSLYSAWVESGRALPGEGVDRGDPVTG
jgi:hypothetical protein